MTRFKNYFQATLPHLDYYRQIYSMDFTNVVVNAAPNPDFNGEELQANKTVKLQEEWGPAPKFIHMFSFAMYAFENFKSLYEDLRFKFRDPDQIFPQSSALPRQGQGKWRGLSRYYSNRQYWWTRYNNPYFGKEERVLNSSSLQIIYEYDLAGWVVYVSLNPKVLFPHLLNGLPLIWILHQLWPSISQLKMEKWFTVLGSIDNVCYSRGSSFPPTIKSELYTFQLPGRDENTDVLMFRCHLMERLSYKFLFKMPQ